MYVCYTFMPSNGLSSTTITLLQGWLWYWMAHEGWYAIKQRNQTKSIHLWFKFFL